MKQNQIQKLKSKKAPCTDSEWEAILEVILLQQESDPEKAAVAEGIEVEAAIEEDVAVELVFKKSTSGITVCPPPPPSAYLSLSNPADPTPQQRLGSLRLLHDEDQEIELFDWCGTSISHSHSLTRTLKSAQSDLLQEQSKTQKLAEQLEDLLKAKGDHEHVLLEKFSLLLNEKKAKIRDLQGGRGEVEMEMGIPSRHKKEEEHVGEENKGKSRRGKRKAETVEPEEGEEMDVDVDEEGREEGATRDTSDEQETEDEDEAPVAAKRGGGSRGGKAEVEAMDEDGSATESEDDGL